MNSMAATEKETRFPWWSAYLQMTLLEARLFLSQRQKFLFFVLYGCSSLFIGTFAFRVENASL